MNMIELNLRSVSESLSVKFLQCDTLDQLHLFILNNCRFWTSEDYYLVCNGHKVSDFEDIDGSVKVLPRLRGGKGGFGSMLRAIGAQIEKTTNREACRDLSGRRLRDINEEQRLKKWISQQGDREKEVEERRKKKLDKLSSEPKHEFKDETYFSERTELTDKLNDAVEQGIQASTSAMKRKVEDNPKIVKKKKKLLIDFDEFSSSSEDAEDEADVTSQHQQEILSNDIVSSSSSLEENKDSVSSN